MGTMAGAISVFTHCKKVKIGVTADVAAIKNLDKLMDLIH